MPLEKERVSNPSSMCKSFLCVSAAWVFDRVAARGADREDARLRRVDNRRELANAVHAKIGDGRCAALVFVRLKRPVPRSAGEYLQLIRDGREGLQLGRRDDRR